jgi:hypothetical protein
MQKWALKREGPLSSEPLIPAALSLADVCISSRIEPEI